jgi:hypothetical protein
VSADARITSCVFSIASGPARLHSAFAESGMPLVTVTRDSVCAADDVDAPHRQVISVPENRDAVAFLLSILVRYPLPSIHGRKATWECSVDGRRIGVVAQQWARPVVHVKQVELERSASLHFIYHAQQEPEGFLAHER